MSIDHADWGTTPEGRGVDLFTLTGPDGIQASVSTYGATLVSLTAPDRQGTFADITLGYDALEDYIQDPYYFGCTIGRFANRIGGARFELGGASYQLGANHGRHHLHGGFAGFNRKVWTANPSRGGSSAKLELTHKSGHLEESYPGLLSAKVVYALENPGELTITFEARTDRATIFNPTNHAYFNLGGHGRGNCLKHELTLRARRFLAVDDESIPTGEIRPVQGTPLDFSRPVAIGKRIRERCRQLEITGGYDHFFVLEDNSSIEEWAARAYDPGTGRELRVYTTQPGIQLYTGNYIKDGIKGRNGATYGPRAGFCLEAQGYPDAPNQPGFPPVTLYPGQPYRHTTRLVFTVG